jgi:hypothetical protein
MLVYFLSEPAIVSRSLANKNSLDGNTGTSSLTGSAQVGRQLQQVTEHTARGHLCERAQRV